MRQELLSAQEKLKNDIATLEKTEGWKKLSERQRAIIKHSQYIQSRAARKTDPESAATIASEQNPRTGEESVQIMNEKNRQQLRFKKGIYGDVPDTRQMRLSQSHIAQWYCFATIANLEGEGPLSVEPPNVPPSFFDGEYVVRSSLDDVRSQIITTGFPCVVNIQHERGPGSEDLSPYGGHDMAHSFLALGLRGGEIIGWDKENDQLPYRPSVTLSQVFKEYPECSWATRRLKAPLGNIS